jgi:hypothetical protein
MPALQRGKRLSASQIAVRAQFVCAWRPRTLRPSRHQPGIAPHNLSLWWADWFKFNWEDRTYLLNRLT